jgi:ABC-type transport system substrate-binding protein
MKTARWLALLVALALLASACDDGGGGGSGDRKPSRGVKRGTLQVWNSSDVEALDPGIAYAVSDFALLRGLVRELYSFDSRTEGEGALQPVPDLADGPYNLSEDGRTYTFKIRRGVLYDLPGRRDVRAEDFIYAVERQFDKRKPSPNPYARLITGVDDFAAGRARTISGMQALDRHTLRITLDHPANDFPSILTLPFFSPVPEEFARKYAPGLEYAQHLIASGPYRLKQYTPDRRIELVRNENWDPRTDPLRTAWVDKISVSIGSTEAGIQQAIETGEADLNLDAVPPPVDDLQRLSGDAVLSRQLAVETTGCVHYLTMQMDAGPTKTLAVRQAVTYVGQSSQRWKDLYGALRTSLARAGIRLKPTFYKRSEIYDKSLRLASRKDEHQLGAAAWCPDVPGNGSRSFVGVLLDGRDLSPTATNNYGHYNNPKVNSLIDQAYKTRDDRARTALWGQIDRQLMEDAAWAPLVYDREAFFWSGRVRNWTFSPWLSNPDITNLWLDPNSP